MNRVAIVVLNWNGADDTLACTASLLAQDMPVDVIIVDNASSDDSVAKIEAFVGEEKNPALHFIKNTVNSGFTGGNNVGFRYALEKNYEFIGTLNPDATAASSWVSQLVSELDSHTDAGIATGILARTDRTHVDSTGDFYTTWGIPSPRGRDTLLQDAPKHAEYIFGSTGGGFIATRRTLETVGLFDEAFFMYFEDVDLCFRSQLAGFKVRYTPDAIAYHKLSASTNKVPGLAITQTFKNLPMLFTKNVPLSLWSHCYPRFVLAYFLILGHAVVKGRGIPAIHGWLQSIWLVPHMFRARRRIQSSRRVQDSYIWSIILHDIPREQTGLRKFRDFFVKKT